MGSSVAPSPTCHGLWVEGEKKGVLREGNPMAIVIVEGRCPLLEVPPLLEVGDQHL